MMFERFMEKAAEIFMWVVVVGYVLLVLISTAICKRKEKGEK